MVTRNSGGIFNAEGAEIAEGTQRKKFGVHSDELLSHTEALRAQRKGTGNGTRTTWNNMAGMKWI